MKHCNSGPFTILRALRGSILISVLVVGLNLSMNAQNLRFWTEKKSEGENYVVTVYTGNMKDGGDAELLKGVNLRYYYESADLQFEKFELSGTMYDARFTNFGGEGNNGFRADDASRYGTADRFVGQAPFTMTSGLAIASGDKVKLGTITFRKNQGLNEPDIDSYLIGAKIFRAMTYTAVPGCVEGCPVIVIPPPGPSTDGILIDLHAEKYGPSHSHLTWNVDSPDQIQGYVVERKVGEANWEELALLKSEGQYVHVYVDENAYDGVTRKQTLSYRIRVNALDGQRMSDIEDIDFDSQKMFIEVFPNPASDKIQVTMTATQTDGNAYLEIYGTDGRLVYRNPILPGSVKEQIDLAASNVDSGSYTVHLVSNGEILDVRSLHVMR